VEAGSLGRRLGLHRVVIPYLASGFSALGCLLSPPARTAMLALGETLESLTPDRLRELVAAAVPQTAGRTLRVALGLRRGENRKEDLLPVEDLAEPAAARVRRYHEVTLAAYGIRPAPRAVAVTRLLVQCEEPSSIPELSALLSATFARARADHAAGEAAPHAAGPNGTPQIPVEALAVDAVAKGPALVVLPGATAFVPAGMPYHADEWGNLILETRA
jgi:N-methylhydantoinase A/oxoprolinase/acetone carboxylase beta subunit